MKARLALLFSLFILFSIPLLTSCHDRHRTVVVGTTPAPRHGPPPHAPAHGYRQKHDGVDIVFDSEWGVYVVLGFPAYYYYDDHYYRYYETGWQVALHVDGPWKIISREAVPPGISAKHAAAGTGKQHPGRGRAPQKGPKNKR